MSNGRPGTAGHPVDAPHGSCRRDVLAFGRRCAATPYSRRRCTSARLIFPTDLSIRPDRLATELEARGFESLWVTEHTHIPTSRRTPWPGGPKLPEEYRRTLDPFVALAAAATVTERLRLGTGISLVAQHDPIVLAKTIATLDLLSRRPGQRSASASAGTRTRWSTTASTRSAAARSTREKVLAMRELWTQDEASFDGEFVSFSPSWSWPKPVATPHPPILMGGAGGPVTFRHVVEYCDGWMPIHGRRSIADKLDDAARAPPTRPGRDMATIELGVFGCPADPAVIDSYAEHGLHPVRARRCRRPARRACCRARRLRRRRRPLRPRLTAILGVDLAWGQGRPGVAPNETGVVAAEADGTIVDAGWTRGVAETAAWMARWATDDAIAMVDAPLVVTNAAGMRECEKEIGRRYGRWKVVGQRVQPRPARHARRRRADGRLAAGGWRVAGGHGGPPGGGRWLYESFPYLALVGAPELGYDRERPVYKRKPRHLAPAEFRALRAANADEIVRRVADAAATRRSTCARTR